MPLIGISAHSEVAAWGVWTLKAALLQYVYVESVAQAGAVPILLPPIESAALDVPTAARSAVAVLDALVLVGGADIDPARYGAEAHPLTTGWRPARDAWELALLEAALERDVPVLCICRGAQLLNVARGGTLRQHLPDDVGHGAHRPAPAEFGTTAVSLEPGALPGTVLGTHVSVPCYHHQAVGELGTGLSVTGRAADGTVEAVQLEGRAFVVGVQWHPESGDDKRLFDALIAATRSGAGAETEGKARTAVKATDVKTDGESGTARAAAVPRAQAAHRTHVTRIGQAAAPEATGPATATQRADR